MSESNVILMDSPRAATLRKIEGWVSRDGRFFGRDEQRARQAGATHSKCGCCDGLIRNNGHVLCVDCREQRQIERYEAMPRKEWDGTAMLYSQARDEFYGDLDGADDDCDEGQSLSDLRLIICDPQYACDLDMDCFVDSLPEDACDMPDWLAGAVRAFNLAIKDQPPLSWVPGTCALAL